MSDETTQSPPQPQDVDPILTNDLTNESPDQPLVPKSEYPMVVRKLDQRKAESSGNSMLNIQLQSISPITAVSGETLPSGGLTLFGRIVITPTEKRTAEQIKRDLKRFQLSCGVKSGPFHPLEQYVGKNCLVSVGFSKVTDEYPEQRNEVKGFVVPE